MIRIADLMIWFVLWLALASVSHAQSLEFGPPFTVTGGFQNPFGVAIDRAQDHLVVADTRNRQLMWTTMASLAGTPTFTAFGLVADPAAPEALIDPQGIAADANGHVYVVDTRKNQVYLYTWTPGSSNYVLDSSFASATRNTVAGSPILLPRDIAVGSDGKVYLLDSGNKRILRAEGSDATSWEVFLTDSSLSNPYGIEVAPDGQVYVADTGNSRIVRYAADGAVPGTAFGSFGTGPGQLRYPRDVAVDVNSRLYVADTDNNRLEILDQNGRHVFALGRAPTFGSIQKVALGTGRQLFISDGDRDAVIAFLGRDMLAPFDGWLRDYVGDTGVEPSDPAFLLASPDILVRHAPDVDLSTASTNGLDSVAFEQPRFGLDNFVYIAVRNRGTQELRDAVLKIYWADPAGALDFPGDWKDGGFFTGTTAASAGNTLEVPPVPAGGTVIVGPVRFQPPAPEAAGGGNGTYVIGARIVQAFDVAPAGGGVAAVRASNNVAVRTVHVTRGPFPTGDQNTLVVRVRYSDDATPVREAGLTSVIDQLARWTSEVSWTMATVRPLFRGEITLPHTRAYYRDPSRNLLVEMASDALDILLTAEPDLLNGITPGPDDDIGRLILVTNDTTSDVDWATTGPWPYHTPAGDRYLTASVQAMGNAAGAFEHGLGHQFSMLDLYAYPNVSFPRPFADGWDAMAQPFNGVHPTVWSKQLATWVTERRADIVFIPRPARGASYTTGANPIPLYLQTSASPGRTIAIAVGLTPGVGTLTDETAFYYLEARSNAGSDADAALPGSGVLIYYVNTQIPQGQGPVILRDHGTSTPGLADAALAAGDTESPPGTGLTATVRAGIAGGPDFLVDIDYSPPQTGYDVSIRIGDPPSTSPDIWVDNQSDGYDEDVGRVPDDRGDIAIGGEENRIYARIHNAGPADAFDVEVAFFISEPWHTVGGEDDFTYLKSVVIPRLPPGDTTVYVTWTPTAQNPHTCVKVVLRRLLDDTNTANNSAQQNLEVLWSTTHSPYTPVEFPFQVTNKEATSKLVYFRADKVPSSWTRQLVPEKIYLAPQQSFVGTLRLVPPPSEKNCSRHNVEVTAWTPASHTLLRIGGATVSVNLAKESGVTVAADAQPCDQASLEKARKADGDKPSDLATRDNRAAANRARRPTGAPTAPKMCMRIHAHGCTDPAQPNADVIVKYKGPDGRPVYHVVHTDANGCYDDFYAAVDGGNWQVGATIAASSCLAPAAATTTVSLAAPAAGPAPNVDVKPVSFDLRGALKPRTSGTRPCAGCSRRTVEHSLSARLVAVGKGTDGDLVVPTLVTVSGSPVDDGVHGGLAQLRLADGTLVVGEVHGTTGVQDRTLTGQFTGLAVEGEQRGNRLTLQYVINLDGDPARGTANGTGRAVGAWLCPCGTGASLEPPRPLVFPDGCVLAVSASGKGSIVETTSQAGTCTTSDMLLTSGSVDAMLQVSPPSRETAGYFDGTFRIRPLADAYSAGSETIGVHEGQFEIVGTSGGRIRGTLAGLTNVDPRKPASTTVPHHLEGTITGTVDTGPLQGCKLRVAYQAVYPPGETLKSAAAEWSLRGAIVCNCRQKIEVAAAGTARPARPSLADQAAAVDRALTARFGRLEDLPQEVRQLARPSPDGSVAATEVANLALAHEAFAALDINRDEFLSAEEWMAGADESLQSLMASLDRNRDGSLDQEEARSIPFAGRRAIDRNGDGRLSRDELLVWIQDGRKHQFQTLDADHDGRISFKEYYLRSPRLALPAPKPRPDQQR